MISSNTLRRQQVSLLATLLAALTIGVATANDFTVAFKYALRNNRDDCKPHEGCRLHNVTTWAIEDAGMEIVDGSRWTQYEACVEEAEAAAAATKKERFLQIVNQGHRQLCGGQCGVLCRRGAKKWCDCCSCCGNRRRLTQQDKPAQLLRRGLTQVKIPQDKSPLEVAMDAEKGALHQLSKWRHRIGCLEFERYDRATRQQTQARGRYFVDVDIQDEKGIIYCSDGTTTYPDGKVLHSDGSITYTDPLVDDSSSAAPSESPTPSPEEDEDSEEEDTSLEDSSEEESSDESEEEESSEEESSEEEDESSEE